MIGFDQMADAAAHATWYLTMTTDPLAGEPTLTLPTRNADKPRAGRANRKSEGVLAFGAVDHVTVERRLAPSMVKPAFWIEASAESEDENKVHLTARSGTTCAGALSYRREGGSGTFVRPVRARRRRC